MNDRYFVGQIVWFAFSFIPRGFVPCIGRISLRVRQYNALFHVIGHSYGGSGDTFGLPDLSEDGQIPSAHGSAGGFYMCFEGTFPHLR